MIYQESDLHKRHQTDFLGTWIIDSLGRKRVSRLIFGKLTSLSYITWFICMFLIKPVCKSYDRSSELHLVYWHKVLHLFNSSNSIEYKYCKIPNISSGLINIRNFWGLIFGGEGGACIRRSFSVCICISKLSKSIIISIQYPYYWKNNLSLSQSQFKPNLIFL